MSRRVTTKTDIKNEEFAVAALAKAGVRSEKVGAGQYSIHAGKSYGVLNLQTGTIEGDSDRFNDSDFHPVRQAYSEVVYMWTLRRQGANVQSRTVQANGDVVIMYESIG